MGLGSWLTRKLSDYLSQPCTPNKGYLCDFDRISYEVRPCDVLLIEGCNRVSSLIRRASNSPWTHASLYIGRLHDIDDPLLREIVHKNYKGSATDQLIVESLIGKGTHIAPLSYYEGEHIRICRPSGLSHHDAQKVIAYAVHSLGMHYNLRHFFDLGRFMLAGRVLPRKWRSSLFKENPNEMKEEICSAMIAAAFKSIKFPVLPLIRETDKKQLELISRNPKLFAPCDFDYSPYFNIIKYPIFSVSEFAAYRDLPWNEAYVSNDDEGLRRTEGEANSKTEKPEE